jgi:penicillin-binding protein 2
MTELRNVEAELQRFRHRVVVASAFVLICFGILLSRFIWLQVVRHEDFEAQAESNRTAVVPIVPNRGLILDRNGIILATNYSAYTLEITPSKVHNMDEMIEALSTIVEIHARDKRRFKKLMEESKSFESLPIRTRLSDEEVAKFAAQRFRFPGVDIKARLFRNYPHGELASHVIGYIGRINQREKELMDDWPDEQQTNYKGTEYIGKLGVEQSFEQQLHGTTGVDEVETSAGGRAVRKLGSSPATPGNTVQLSLDIKLQHMIEQLFGERRGALVAIDPRNGEVLAFVSKPTFDPNLFVEGIDVENWKELNESIDKPLLNRALRGTYPPGSTYKPFMALAALESGKRSPSTSIYDPGFWMFGNHRFRSHGDSGLGAVDMHRSIVKSSNVYYYTLANELGVDAMHDFMKPLSFGQVTGIDVNGEVRGVLPSQEWKRNTYKRPEQKKWYAGETISLGIGQGYNNFTMLQLAQATAILAAGGIKHQPRVVTATQDALSRQWTPAHNGEAENLGYKPDNIAVIHRALAAVATEGTSARVFAGAGYASGGKTGTAQAVTIGQKDRYDARRLEEHQRDHSLYMAFAPMNEPKIALAVVVENSGFGAEHAAPIARRVFDYWLMGQYPSDEDIAASQKGQASAPIGKQRVAKDMPWPPAGMGITAAGVAPLASTGSVTSTASASVTTSTASGIVTGMASARAVKLAANTAASNVASNEASTAASPRR